MADESAVANKNFDLQYFESKWMFRLNRRIVGEAMKSKRRKLICHVAAVDSIKQQKLMIQKTFKWNLRFYCHIVQGIRSETIFYCFSLSFATSHRDCNIVIFITNPWVPFYDLPIHYLTSNGCFQGTYKIHSLKLQLRWTWLDSLKCIKVAFLSSISRSSNKY